jgi:hypothetical protein
MVVGRPATIAAEAPELARRGEAAGPGWQRLTAVVELTE